MAPGKLNVASPLEGASVVGEGVAPKTAVAVCCIGTVTDAGACGQAPSYIPICSGKEIEQPCASRWRKKKENERK